LYLYYHLKRGAPKSDYWRILNLYLHGGIYSDLDNSPKIPIREWNHYPFDEIGMYFGMESLLFAEQYFLIAAPRHPLLAEFLRIYKDTYDHDKAKYDTLKLSIEYGGPGMWTYAIYTLCNYNPENRSNFHDYQLNEGKGYDYDYENRHGFVAELRTEYNTPGSKIRQCCDHYKIVFSDGGYFGSDATAHYKKNG
jgi:hypothetical protein